MMKKVLGVTTNKELASFLGITAEHISRLYKQESLSEKYVDRRLIHAHKEIQRRARKQAFQTAISPLVEFYPIDLTLSRRAANWELFDANSSTYAAGLRDSLEEHHGIYVFFDSRGKSIYVGKAKRQSLWMEMNSALNRKRKNLQRMMLVSHPTRNQQFIPSCDKPRQIVECNVFLSDIATYFSAYSVADEFIDIAESLLIRCFPNNLLNKKMEQAVLSHPNPSGWLSFLVIRLPLKNFPHSVHILEHRHGNLEESGVCPAALGKTPTLHRKQQDDTP